MKMMIWKIKVKTVFVQVFFKERHPLFFLQPRLSSRHDAELENDNISNFASENDRIGEMADCNVSMYDQEDLEENGIDDVPVENPHQFPFCGSQMPSVGQNGSSSRKLDYPPNLRTRLFNFANLVF